jgi:hypothetical protein
VQVQCQILDAEQPQLVVFSGDQVSGYAYKDRSAGWFEARWAQHDSSAPLSDAMILQARLQHSAQQKPHNSSVGSSTFLKRC